MMSAFVEIHPQTPQPRLVRQAAEVVREGGVIVYPTDTCYALGCAIGEKDARDRIRRIRGIPPDHRFTLICRDLSESATYAVFDTSVYRMLKANTPGAYAFILKGTREVPRRLMDPKRKTIGLRVPDHPIALALLTELDAPMMTSSLILRDETEPLTDPETIRERLDHQVDLIIDGGMGGSDPTTVVDLTGEVPRVIRVGKGDPSPFE
jgi:tRNA threonylcarbamoyl adenosine modification protein (Sua5/YciO/YrdC/YwlC family)